MANQFIICTYFGLFICACKGLWEWRTYKTCWWTSTCMQAIHNQWCVWAIKNNMFIIVSKWNHNINILRYNYLFCTFIYKGHLAIDIKCMYTFVHRCLFFNYFCLLVHSFCFEKDNTKYSWPDVSYKHHNDAFCLMWLVQHILQFESARWVCHWRWWCQ